jgi:hypothetical protein
MLKGLPLTTLEEQKLSIVFSGASPQGLRLEAGIASLAHYVIVFFLAQKLSIVFLIIYMSGEGGLSLH